MGSKADLYSREYIMYSFSQYISKGTAFRLLQGLTYKWPGKAKTLQF